jgi:hypothetical protein
VPRQLRYWDGRAWSEHVARPNPDPVPPADIEASRADDLGAEAKPRDLAPNQPGQRLDVGGLQWTEPLQPSAPLRSVGVYRGPKGRSFPPPQVESIHLSSTWAD